MVGTSEGARTETWVLGRNDTYPQSFTFSEAE